MAKNVSTTSSTNEFLNFVFRAALLSLPIFLAINVPRIDAIASGVAAPFSFEHQWLYVVVYSAVIAYFTFRLGWVYGYEWHKLSAEMEITDPNDTTERLTEIALRFAESTNDATRAFVIFILGCIVLAHSLFLGITTLPILILSLLCVLLAAQAFWLQTSLSFGQAFIDKIYLICRKANAGVAVEWQPLRDEIYQNRETERFKKNWPTLYFGGVGQEKVDSNRGFARYILSAINPRMP